ncbi:MAG: hypothetical protein J6B22_06135 [Clostridia bacterium]|nr:hypothetical protein [Clostridia bacterium]
MVILFSNRKSKLEKEIVEILIACGADVISDKSVVSAGGFFTLAICYKKTEIKTKKAIALYVDDSLRFKNQILPDEVIGICEDKNINALENFKKNKVAVVTCGNNPKNTITLSSIENGNYILTLQRQITNLKGDTLCPADYKITLEKQYSPEAVMLSGAVLCLIDRN